MLAAASTRIEATVENVYGNAILLDWTVKNPIYGQSHSDDMVSDGNFLGSASPISTPRPIIGYKTIFSKNILVVNYPTDGIAQGQNLSLKATQIGTTNFLGTTIELWDAGIKPITPEQLQEMKDEEIRFQSNLQKQKMIVAEMTHRNFLLGQSNAVRWLQPQATNGDASAQCSLGEHYLNGLGCETNLTQGIYWLTQAANQGDLEASNKLNSLKK